MSKTKNDEVYEEGVRDGLEGDVFEDFAQNLKRPLDFTQQDEIYNKGYKWGTEHRYDCRHDEEDSVFFTGTRERKKTSKEEVDFCDHEDFYSRSEDDISYTYELTPEQLRQETWAGWGIAMIVIVPIVCFIGLIIGSIVEQNVRQAKATQEIIENNALVKIEEAKDNSVSNWAKDYSLSSDKSKIAFSQQIMTLAYYTPWDSHNDKLFRIFLKDLDKDNQRLIEFNGADKKIFREISSEDFVAPLFSPDNRKIAFAVTRSDHPSAVYVVDGNGVNLKRVSCWPDTVAFGWISNNTLFVWISHYTGANIFDPFVYSKGASYLIDVVKGITPEQQQRIDFMPFGKSKYIPSNAVKIKHVSRGGVKDYIIKRKNE